MSPLLKILLPFATAFVIYDIINSLRTGEASLKVAMPKAYRATNPVYFYFIIIIELAMLVLFTMEIAAALPLGPVSIFLQSHGFSNWLKN